MRFTLILCIFFALACLAAADPKKKHHQNSVFLPDQDGHHYKAHPKHHKSGKHKKHKQHKGHKKHKQHKKHKKHGKHHDKKHYNKHKVHKNKPKPKHHKKPPPVDADSVAWHARCVAKNEKAAIAADTFCVYEKTVTVPSDYAKKGKVFKNNRAMIGYPSNCDPPAKIGWKECRKHFYKICAEGDENGHGYQKFGPGGCQAYNLNLDHFNVDTNRVTMVN